jgi:hypothetical protein
VFLQLSGKARLVVRVTIAQMVINLLLDLLLIIGLGWGLRGAVLATIGSYLLSLVMIVPEVRRQWRISVCTEDIMYSLVSRHQQEKKQSKEGYFDIRLMEMMDEKTHQSQGIQMFVKARGKSYDPVQNCATDTELLLTGCNMAMLLVNRLSDGIDYNYRNGVNCTILKFYRKNEEK